MIFYALTNAWGGEIFVPKIPSIKIIDLIKTIKPNAKIKLIGIRPGEKIDEHMITTTDGQNTYELKNYYIIMNNFNTDLKNKFLNKSTEIITIDIIKTSIIFKFVFKIGSRLSDCTIKVLLTKGILNKLNK